MLKFVLTFAVSLILTTICYANDIYPFADKKQEAQFQYLLKELRCPVCQNQDLADSNADVAKDLRQEVYKMVVTNKTDEEIIGYLTTRFGDFILFKPQLKSVTFLLWFGPVVFGLVGLLVFMRSIKRRSNAA